MKFINLGSMNNKLHIVILFMRSGGCRISRHAARPSSQVVCSLRPKSELPGRS